METLYDEHRKPVADLFAALSGDNRRELVRLLGSLRGRLQDGCCQGSA
ncbi:MAG: hypothetical protein AVDCRST_MAG25-3183 [uncultured Rubrobacteraceae bacterium]|uniref:Uncharacterized protein n=1 Tax=uncultured Rubrobacteraceae bacterium TaxID=349277 RepID=A0A6J4S1W9_9ACTN|nr:MAG: hypothetical protein AVDCRST_MAG25-3183 [uncultured Rubrobacteraceae bacterium]